MKKSNDKKSNSDGNQTKLQKSQPDNCKRNENSRKRHRKKLEPKLSNESTNPEMWFHGADKMNVDSNWKKLLKIHPDICKRKGNNLESLVKKPEREPNIKESTKPEIWFDDVDEIYLEGTATSRNEPENTRDDPIDDNPLVKSKSFDGLTRLVAMDCEMVGVGDDGEDSILARVSIVNHFGKCVYDKYVKPTEDVTDYRTAVSGIRPSDIENGEDFKKVQKDVSDILKGRVLVGHAIYNDLKVLYLDHPRKSIRDTSKYKPFRKLFNGRIPSLKNLSERLLGVKVQSGEHNSVQDAQATMRLYTMHLKRWESELKPKSRRRNRIPKNNEPPEDQATSSKNPKKPKLSNTRNKSGK